MSPDLQARSVRARSGAGATVFDRVCDDGRDPLGRITRREEQILTTGGVLDTRLETYAYDAAGRLSTLSRYAGCTCTGTCTVTPAVWSYTYDQRGNRTGVTPAANEDDQPLQGDRLYNADGQLRQRGLSGTIRYYTYDRQDRLRRYVAGATDVRYAYDGRGRLVRVQQLVSGVLAIEETFVYRDGLNPIAWSRIVCEGTCYADATAYFGYGSRRHTPDIMWRDVGSNGTIDQTYRVVHDERGSVRLVVNLATNAVAERIDYDAWGQPTITGNVSLQPFGYIGGIRDGYTGFWRLGARDYDPLIGRWTTKDPIRFAGGTNLYAYCANDPINCTDPSGLTRLFVFVQRGEMLVDPETGAPLYSVPITTGQGACMNVAIPPDCQSRGWQGPIPVGRYELRTSEISNPNWLWDELRNTQGDFGDWRVLLHPDASTDVHGRSGIFLHGGARAGSAGCVDFGGGVHGSSLTNQLLNDLLADPDGLVPVVVVP